MTKNSKKGFSLVINDIKGLTRPESRPFLRMLYTVALPIIFQELINALVNILDSLMIGSLSLFSINAVGFANELFFLFGLLLFGVNSAASIFMGQLWGKNDAKGIRKILGLSTIISVTGSMIFVAIALFIPEQFINLYNKEPEVARLGAEYLRIVAPTYVITAFVTAIGSALRCMRQTKIPVFATVAALLTNFLLNLLFIFGFGWGVAGAALATVIARLVQTVVLLMAIVRLRLPLLGPLKDFRGHTKASVKEYFILAFPVMVNEMVWAIGQTMYNIAYRFYDAEAQGAVRIASTIYNIFTVASVGIGAACGIIVANALGAGELDEAKELARKCLVILLIVAILTSSGLILVIPLILGIYNVPQQTIDYAHILLCITAVSAIVKTYNYTTIVGILRSGGDTKYCLMLDMVSVWLVGVPAVFLSVYVFKWPIYISFSLVMLEEVYKIILSTRRVIGCKWVKCLV